MVPIVVSNLEGHQLALLRAELGLNPPQPTAITARPTNTDIAA